MTTQDDIVKYMQFRHVVTTNSNINTREDLLSRLINEHSCTRNVASHNGVTATDYIIDIGTGGLWDTRNVTGVYLKFKIRLTGETSEATVGTAGKSKEININEVFDTISNSAYFLNEVEVENSKYKIRDIDVHNTSRIYQQMLPKEFLEMYPLTFSSHYNKPVTYTGTITEVTADGKTTTKKDVIEFPVELFIPVWLLHSCWRNMQMFPAFLLGIKTVRVTLTTKAFSGGYAEVFKKVWPTCTSAFLDRIQFKTLNRNLDNVFDDYRQLLSTNHALVSSVDKMTSQYLENLDPGRVHNHEMTFAFESVKYLVIEALDASRVPTGNLSPIKSISIRQGAASDKKVMSDPLNLDELKMYTLNCLQELACDGPIDGYKHNPSIDTSRYIVLNLGVLDTNPGMTFVGYNNYDKYTAIQLEIEVNTNCNLRVFACSDYLWRINSDGTMTFTDKNPKNLTR